MNLYSGPRPVFELFDPQFFEYQSRICKKNIILLAIGSGKIFFPGFYEKLTISYADGRKAEEYRGGVFSDENIRNYLSQPECEAFFRDKNTMTFIHHKGIDKLFYCLFAGSAREVPRREDNSSDSSA